VCLCFCILTDRHDYLRQLKVTTPCKYQTILKYFIKWLHRRLIKQHKCYEILKFLNKYCHSSKSSPLPVANFCSGQGNVTCRYEVLPNLGTLCSLKIFLSALISHIYDLSKGL
jgi:hypothetical protein